MPTSHPADAAICVRPLEETAGMLATVRLHIVWLLAAGGRDVGTRAEETGQTTARTSLCACSKRRRTCRRQLTMPATFGSSKLLPTVNGSNRPGQSRGRQTPDSPNTGQNDVHG